MVMALMPAGSATALGHPDEPRDTDTACPDDYDNPYPDLSSANPHYDSIVCMTDYGIARGFTDGTYRPPSNVTRDQMATFIANLIDEVADLPTGEHRFDDVGEESPHYQNIHDLAEAGVVLGYDEDTYGPRDFVRRDQMASFIARAIDYVDNGEVDGSAPPQSEGANYFTDVFAANEHSEAIGALADAAIVVGYGDDTYGPRDLTRRDQMASFIMRALDYILETSEVTPPPPGPDPDPEDGSISGVVLDEAEDTIEGAVVWLDETDTAEIAPDGSYTFTDVEPGDYTVTADAPWHDAASIEVEVGDGEDVVDVDFFLFRQAEIVSAELTVDTPEEGVANEGDAWQITFSEAMDTDSDGATITLSETDGDGTFTAQCVPDEGTFVGDNTLALCEWGDANDGVDNVLTVTLLEEPQPGDETFTYPLIIDDTTLTTATGGSTNVVDSDEDARIIGGDANDENDDNGNAVEELVGAIG
jgi:hypothetical protein